MTKGFDRLTAADVMRGGVVGIPTTLSLRGAARVMAEAGACAAPVTDTRGRCVGLLHASDVLGWVAEGDAVSTDPGGFWSEWQLPAPAAGEVGGWMAPIPAAVTIDRRYRPAGVLSPADVLAAVAADPPPEANGRSRHPGPARGSAPVA